MSMMAKVYADLIRKGKKTVKDVPKSLQKEVKALLIIKGKKTYGDVPAKLKEQVKEVLIDMEVPELAAD